MRLAKRSLAKKAALLSIPTSPQRGDSGNVVKES
jgi:hypothetical protein